MKSYKTSFIIILFLFCVQCTVQAKSPCSTECSFNDFFKDNYKNLIQYLCPNEEQEKFFNILFNAYSIKFQGLDYEYESLCAESDECLQEKKKYIKSLSTIAMDEYDSFLDDLSFETCGCEGVENPTVKKNKKKYRRHLKKLISKHCK